jgi:hypothetical protein
MRTSRQKKNRSNVDVLIASFEANMFKVESDSGRAAEAGENSGATIDNRLGIGQTSLVVFDAAFVTSPTLDMSEKPG